MNKAALIIGRFQPFHLGHLRLMERYAKAGFFIKVGIGSANKQFEKDNPLTYEERKEIIFCALKEANIKKFKIYSIPDIKEDKHYVKHVLKIVTNFNTIITGNKHVLKLFRDYKTGAPWNIESFEESNRPGGKINASLIRKIWSKRPSKKGLLKSTFNHLKLKRFSERLRKLR